MNIAHVATLDNALAYAGASEKFLFCVDLLEISAHDDNADLLVNKLEDLFEVQLKIQGLEAQLQNEQLRLAEAKKKGWQYGIHAAEGEIEVLCCLIGNEKQTLEELTQ